MGRSQVLAVAILGAWIMSTLCMWFAATRSFATVESVLKRAEHPQFVETTKPLGEGLHARGAALHGLGNQSHAFLGVRRAPDRVWGRFCSCWSGGRQPRNAVDIGVVATMLALSVILTLVITPLLVSLGRSIDFLPRNPPPPVMPRFWALHGSFTGLDGVKLLAGIGLLIRWIFR